MVGSTGNLLVGPALRASYKLLAVLLYHYCANSNAGGYSYAEQHTREHIVPLHVLARDIRADGQNALWRKTPSNRALGRVRPIIGHLPHFGDVARCWNIALRRDVIKSVQKASAARQLAIGWNAAGDT